MTETNITIKEGSKVKVIGQQNLHCSAKTGIVSQNGLADSSETFLKMIYAYCDSEIP